MTKLAYIPICFALVASGCNKNDGLEPIEVPVIDTNNRTPWVDFMAVRQDEYIDGTIQLVDISVDPEGALISSLWTVDGIAYEGESISFQAPSDPGDLQITHTVSDAAGNVSTVSRSIPVRAFPTIQLTINRYQSNQTGDGNQTGELYFATNAVVVGSSDASSNLKMIPDIQNNAVPYVIYGGTQLNFTGVSGLIVYSGAAVQQIGVSIIAMDQDSPAADWLSLFDDIVNSIGTTFGPFVPELAVGATFVTQISGHIQQYIQQHTEDDVLDQLSIVLNRGNNWLISSAPITLPGPNGTAFTVHVKVL